jgi:uncharacterized membrane protein YwzB
MEIFFNVMYVSFHKINKRSCFIKKMYSKFIQILYNKIEIALGHTISRIGSFILLNHTKRVHGKKWLTHFLQMHKRNANSNPRQRKLITRINHK